MRDNIILEQNIKLGGTAEDWQDAMRQAGQLLIESGFITKEYIEATIQAVKEFGPYIVITPGLALAHARPDESVLNTGIGLMTFAEPVQFNCEFDPVDIVLVLAAKNHDDHQEMLKRLSFYLAESGKMEFIRASKNIKALATDINAFEVED